MPRNESIVRLKLKPKSKLSRREKRLLRKDLIKTAGYYLMRVKSDRLCEQIVAIAQQLVKEKR